MSSQVLRRAADFTTNTSNGHGENINYRNANGHGKKETTSKPRNFQNGNAIGEGETVVYDVPQCNLSIFSKPQSNKDPPTPESLIPSAARLILRQSYSNSPESRSDILENDFDSEGLDISGEEESIESDPPDFIDEVLDNSPPREKTEDFNYQYPDFTDSDYGLGVIHEETESQISSSDEEEEEELKSGVKLHKVIPYSTSFTRTKMSNTKGKENCNGSHADPVLRDLSPVDLVVDKPPEESLLEEIVAKHIRISPNWDPEPILNRLYTITEPKQLTKSNTIKEPMTGFLNILSGNRKKGTFWNAWRKKFYVLSSGKLCGYDKENFQGLFHAISLTGGKVDFLDPTDFVGADQKKVMTNRIVGIDDARGHYYVLQCSDTKEAAKWVAALQSETLPSALTPYAVPFLPKSISVFRDVILVDFGSTNIRAGVLSIQPTLPALFFAAVMSENDKGDKIYGNDVYLRENRQNAKIKFPVESTAKFSQNNLSVETVKGFLLKIFDDLRIFNPEKYRVIINLPRRVDNTCKKNILGLLFDTFQVKGALLCHQSVASFWSYSSENGIVCDIGERCDIVPLSQGFVLSHAWKRAPFGGQPLKHALRQGLGPQENGLYLSTPAENLVLRHITENFIYTNTQTSRRMSQESQEVVVEMDLRDVLSIPTLIGVNQNVLRGVGEGFFDPGLYGIDCDSLPKLLFQSLQDTGMELKKEMSQNIFVAGGCTTIPGFVERLEAEVTKLCPPHLKPKIQASPYRYHASFIGASVLSTTDAFEKSVLPRNKYDGGPGPDYWLI